MVRKRRKSQGYLRVSLYVIHFTGSDLICCHGLQIQNVHLLLHSLRLEKQGNLMQRDFIILSPSTL